MLKVGLTGGIGSGKSTIATIFRQLEVPVYYSDSAAKKLIVTDGNIISQIKSVFGSEIFNDSGKLESKKLADKVFNNEELLKDLNAIIHPAVRKDFVEWIKKHFDIPYILNESAIIFEHDLYKELDAVIVILAPENVRIKRVMERDGIDEKEVKQRILNQITDEERKQKGDFFIINDETQAVIPQILKIHAELNKKVSFK
jgi:dephospho-CoA kinase